MRNLNEQIGMPTIPGNVTRGHHLEASRVNVIQDALRWLGRGRATTRDLNIFQPWKYDTVHFDWLSEKDIRCGATSGTPATDTKGLHGAVIFAHHEVHDPAETTDQTQVLAVDDTAQRDYDLQATFGTTWYGFVGIGLTYGADTLIISWQAFSDTIARDVQVAFYSLDLWLPCWRFDTTVDGDRSIWELTEIYRNDEPLVYHVKDWYTYTPP
jgi:hypothetical protein